MQIHKEGKVQVTLTMIIMTLLYALILYFGSAAVKFIALLPYLFVAQTMISFYANPERKYRGEEKGYVCSPNDGKVVVIEHIFENKFIHKECIQISVYMTFFDSHCNWVPVSGKITHLSHQEGNFHRAFLPKSSTENEHTSVVIETPEGYKILTKQIAGAYARRIVTYLQEGDSVKIGDELGFIKFGSRMDIFVPIGSEILVEVGQKVRFNQTLLAKLPQKTENN
ncbi:MAG: phosphatidylserine decarboxylase family protein [Dysgonamonadaceae bacterium]|jgi:phosphatidylserine decarboxylase|nr:phosphatidylserine decarboxylase family protein [Dysgonamonadaceae bacterium]MDD3308824.1 phosphatidylserine decarboxylase family protein [Dysgonamonadaceae bacterium]MDD3901193.1 phosphatidylserine decarboxylase family protein [Dysgonamonadaceae bacterium]MDD4398967.1 phosphatidylserine decarboxylase family protein [Dysgonamonadaceae bacterium]